MSIQHRILSYRYLYFTLQSLIFTKSIWHHGRYCQAKTSDDEIITCFWWHFLRPSLTLHTDQTQYQGNFQWKHLGSILHAQMWEFGWRLKNNKNIMSRKRRLYKPLYGYLIQESILILMSTWYSVFFNKSLWKNKKTFPNCTSSSTMTNYQLSLFILEHKINK